MTFRKVFVGTMSLFILAVATVSPAKADPLFFSNVVALQNNGNTSVDLFSSANPTILANPNINFLVDITGSLPSGSQNTLRLIYAEAGSAPVEQTFLIPLFGTVNPPFTFLFSFTSAGASPGGTPATLTVDILGSAPDFIFPTTGNRVDSYTYSFNVASVPEPSSILLLGTAMIGLARRLRSRR